MKIGMAEPNLIKSQFDKFMNKRRKIYEVILKLFTN